MNRKTIHYMLLASITAVLSISSMQVTASGRYDRGGPNQLCFHLAPTPNHLDPEGSFIMFRLGRRSALNVMGSRLVLREARGMAIGRAPTPGAVEPFGEWVGTPWTGTCHKHKRELQCSFQSISSISTELPLGGPAALAIETGAGHFTLVFNLTDKTTAATQIGSVNVAYFDPAGDRISDSDAAALNLPTFKKIFDHIKDFEQVNCKKVPHPDIPDFHIPMPM